MKFLKTIGLFSLFATLLFTSCLKDEDSSGSFTPGSPNPEIIVNGSLSGVVTDESNQAIEDALVSFGSNSSTTDENGYFSFKNVEINSKGSLVTIEKGGYFYNAKFVDSKLGKQNFTKIKLIKKILTGAFMTDAGGTVATSDGASIEFTANSIKQEGGGTYTGNVNVYATWLDPTASDLAQRMPGDLRGVNAANEQQQLTTYGMIGVELEGNAGEILNIAEGQTATIELPVPAELAATAPSTIPLWHFDELTGYWVEDGEAILQDGKYVGTVNHFSFWNCDVPNDFIYIEGIVTDLSGGPLQNILVSITETSSGMVGYDLTDEDGLFAGLVPVNQELMISIIVNCSEVIYNDIIGPFSTDAVIPTISVAPTGNFITVSGTLVDCGGNAVTDGYLKVDLGSSTVLLSSDADGQFSGLIHICGTSTFEVTGYNLDDLTQSQPTIEDVSPGSVLDLASVLVCDDLTEYLIFNIGGIRTIDLTPAARLTAPNGVPNTLVIWGSNPDSTAHINIELSVSDTAPGTYTPDEILATYVDQTPQSIKLQCDLMCDAIMEITTFETVGGFIIGSFSGTLEPSGSTGTTQSVDGAFKILLE